MRYLERILAKAARMGINKYSYIRNSLFGIAKAEKEFYRNFICAWLEQDQDRYLAAIEKISKDMRKKIFAVLKRENLYTA